MPASLRGVSVVHLDRGRSLAHAALAEGGEQVRLSTVSRDVSGRCERPIVRTIVGRPGPGAALPQPRFVEVGPGYGPGPIYIDYTVRCRRCAACLRARRAEWAARCLTELRRANRTWFATLTFRPEVHVRVLAAARDRDARRGIDFDGRPEPEQFATLHAEHGREITKYFKRLRKQTDAPIRYIVVAEAHSERLRGLPHYHGLVHEVDPFKPVRWSDLDRQWQLGHAQYKLVDHGAKASWYLAKYLAKDTRARIRASVRYGRDETAYPSLPDVGLWP